MNAIPPTNESSCSCFSLAPAMLRSFTRGTRTLGATSVIRSQEGFRYTVTEGDIHWLAVSAWREGGDPAATVWTYLQRLVNTGRNTLGALVICHSQPINPIWRRRGCKCLDPDNASRCTERQLAQREQNTRYSVDDVPENVWNTLRGILRGEIANPVPGATDFADRNVTPRSMASRRNRGEPSTLIKKAGNWYISEGTRKASVRDSADWPIGYVFVESEGRRSPPGPYPVRDSEGGEVLVAQVEEGVENVVDSVVEPVKRAPSLVLPLALAAVLLVGYYAAYSGSKSGREAAV